MNEQELEFFEREGITCHDVIASGAYGVIFNVFHKSYNDFFALKKIPFKNFQEEEVECLMNIDDPRIVKLYKCYKFDDSAYLLMEYCKTDLGKYLRTHKITSQEELKRIIYDVIAAIKVCHDNGVAHCDIKPSNFMIDNYGRIKIGDFGLSMIHQNACGSCRGTLMFMAPEVFNKKRFNPLRADIWSLGVLIYYIVTNTYPFMGMDARSLIECVIQSNYDESLLSTQPLKNLVGACLDKDPKARASADQLLCMSFFSENSKHVGISQHNSLRRLVVPRIQIRSSSSKEHSIYFHQKNSESCYV